MFNFAPLIGYKANIISTIVDLEVNFYCHTGYKANIISTIVDPTDAS